MRIDGFYKLKPSIRTSLFSRKKSSKRSIPMNIPAHHLIGRRTEKSEKIAKPLSIFAIYTPL